MHCKYFKKAKDQIRKPLTGFKKILKCERGDFYISDGVKIIIAVVLGALLLTALTALFNDTIIPRITSEIQSLFGT